MFLSFMILIFSAFSSWAEARVITFQDAVSLVSQNNPGLKAARENTQSSEELVGGSKSGFFPSLTGSVNATHDFPNTNVPYLDTQSGVAYSSSLTMSYNLFSGFKDVASVQQAKSQLAISRASLDSTKSSISNSLRQGFITLKYAQAKVKLTVRKRRRKSGLLSFIPKYA
jgi:outer membrane protein